MEHDVKELEPLMLHTGTRLILVGMSRIPCPQGLQFPGLVFNHNLMLVVFDKNAKTFFQTRKFLENFHLAAWQPKLAEVGVSEL